MGMLPTSVPIWMTALAAGFAPISLVILVYAISPRDESQGWYGILGVLVVLSYFYLAPYIAPLTTRFIDPTMEPVPHAIVSNFTISLGGQFSVLLPFYIWLAALRQKTSTHCICGAVSSALVFTMILNFISLQILSSDPNQWLYLFVARSLLQVPSIAVTAMVMGVWTAVVVKDWRIGNAWALAATFAVVELGDGLWFAAADLRYTAELSASIWLPCFVISAILRLGMLILGIRALDRLGVSLRIPQIS